MVERGASKSDADCRLTVAGAYLDVFVDTSSAADCLGGRRPGQVGSGLDACGERLLSRSGSRGPKD